MRSFRSKTLPAFVIHLLLSFLFFIPSVVVADPDPDILGFWYTQDRDGIIQIYKCDQYICGRFHWLKPGKEGEVSRDKENPDPARRNTPLCNMQFMGDFIMEDPQHYNHGWIYNPDDGQTYGAQMTLVDHNTLDLHGYVFLPLLGASRTWTRTDAALSCNGNVP